MSDTSGWNRCLPSHPKRSVHIADLEAEVDKLRDRNRVLAEAVVKQTNRIIELECAYEVLEGTYKRWRKEFYVADPWARLV